MISLGLKLSTFNIQIPADEKIQMADFTTALTFEDTCTKNAENIALSADNTHIVNLDANSVNLFIINSKDFGTISFFR